VDAETAKVVEITIERDDLRASCSKLQAELSDLQQSIQLANKAEETSRLTIEELQAQIHDQKQAFHAQSDALASALEGANASRDALHSSLIAAKTILDQLQMTNESSRDYGSTLLEVRPPPLPLLNLFPPPFPVSNFFCQSKHIRYSLASSLK
jgi:hypothetical protein